MKIQWQSDKDCGVKGEATLANVVKGGKLDQYRPEKIRSKQKTGRRLMIWCLYHESDAYIYITTLLFFTSDLFS